jgi:hypothetical protein
MNKLYVFLFCLWSSVACVAGNPEDQLKADIQKTRGHFAASRQQIAGYLKGVEDAQLHFFWTTGFTLSDNEDYKPNRKVHIGGRSYSQKFFPAVTDLLNNAPDKLKVRLVCDDLTLQSNRVDIDKLIKTFGARFEILPVDDVRDSLLAAFPNQANPIKIVFKNAVAGLPVLTSDVYRVVGLYYGQKTLPTSKSVRTYCDIDAFSDGMEHKSYENMVKSLFEFVQKPGEANYKGKKSNNNDLIKMCITDLSEHKMFCEKRLSDIRIDRGVFTYYTSLHDMAKKCEIDKDYCNRMKDWLPEPHPDRLGSVMQATGEYSGFLSGLDNKLTYFSNTVGSWHTAGTSLDHTYSRGGNLSHPNSLLFWPYSAPDDIFKTLFSDVCEDYRRYVDAFFQLRRLGEEHPFIAAVKQNLQNNYPYHHKSFKDMLKLNFEWCHRDVKRTYILFVSEREPRRLNRVNFTLKEVDGGGESNSSLLNFVFKTTDDDVVRGSVNIPYIEDNDEAEKYIRDNKPALMSILQKNHGLKPLPDEKGMTYKEWKKETLLRFIHKDYARYHYQALNRVLAKAGITFPPVTEAFFDGLGLE